MYEFTLKDHMIRYFMAHRSHCRQEFDNEGFRFLLSRTFLAGQDKNTQNVMTRVYNNEH